MESNFDIHKFLSENKLTRNSKLVEEVSMDNPENDEKVLAAVNNILKDLSDRGNDFKQIKNKRILLQLLDGIMGLLDPEFIQDNQFKMGVRDFFTKYK